MGGSWIQALGALQAALEDEEAEDRQVRECRVQVACEWISHAGKQLLWWACENIGWTGVTVEDEAVYWEGGPLYKGPPLMCLRRWGFWLDRLSNMGKSESDISDETRKTVLATAQYMRDVEMAIGHSFLSG